MMREREFFRHLSVVDQALVDRWRSFHISWEWTTIAKKSGILRLVCSIPFRLANIACVNSIRYPDPLIKVNDTVKINLETGKIEDFVKFDTGAIAMVTGGRNMGRVGVITHRERHDGGFAIVHLKDAIDNTFATRETNVFVIGQEKPWISLPKGKGVKLTIAEERDRRRAQALAH
jgi:small subunit ribosomal protein S4e